MILKSLRVAAALRDPGAGSVCKSERGVGHSGSAGRTVCAIGAVTALTLLAAPAVGVRPAAAQVIPKSLQQGAPEKDIRTTKNAWTVGIVGGLASGTYMRFAVELARALDDGDNLRVLPIVSFGA